MEYAVIGSGLASVSAIRLAGKLGGKVITGPLNCIGDEVQGRQLVVCLGQLALDDPKLEEASARLEQFRALSGSPPIVIAEGDHSAIMKRFGSHVAIMEAGGNPEVLVRDIIDAAEAAI